MNNLLERFIRYIKIDTESDNNSENTPSTSKQFNLAKILVEELKNLGLQDAHVDEKCYVMATLPSNIEKKVPTIGFIAHMDTSPDFSGKDVTPQIIKNYNGKDITLNENPKIILSTSDFPDLKKYVGKTLITTDGTTLLGADDKAGIAEIMTALEYLKKNPETKHGTLKIGYTPDEEIGRGADYFDVEKFNADFAYTIDGGPIGELEYENFNAAGAKITVLGRNVHPGTAKNQMINAQHIAMEFNSLLPSNQRPEHTEKYEGFFHLISFIGDVERTELQYIIRDHDKKLFKKKKKLMLQIADFLNNKYQRELIQAEIKDQYLNMKEKIEPVMHIVELAEKAMKQVDVKPNIKAIRGGTDGARLSFMGLPTPNIFGGGHNFHGKFEFIPLESMQKAVEVIVKIIELNAEQ
ncbi:MAG: peptidase T [Bacteroidales bacterium]|nr:peptidase T [Bacteroidales bacterium]